MRELLLLVLFLVGGNIGISLDVRMRNQRLCVPDRHRRRFRWSVEGGFVKDII
jgi:hypothetical protein